MGAVQARGVGSAVITAALSASLQATTTVEVTAWPVIGVPAVEANTRRATMLAFTTDTAAAIAAVLADDSSGALVQIVLTTPDPARKHHRAVLAGLASGASYRLTPAAVNEFALGALGPAVVVTVP